MADTLVDYFAMKEEFLSVNKLPLDQPEPLIIQDTLKHMQMIGKIEVVKSKISDNSDLSFVVLKKN